MLSSGYTSGQDPVYKGHTEKEMCMNLASYYAKGSIDRYLSLIKEIRLREYGLYCKEIAELQMISKRPDMLGIFKLKLDELFGPSPTLNSDSHFLTKSL